MMAFGIMVTEWCGRYAPFTMVSEEMLDGLRKGMCEGRYGMNYVAGKNGISDDEIDELSKKVVVVNKKNSNADLNLRNELKGLGLVLGNYNERPKFFPKLFSSLEYIADQFNLSVALNGPLIVNQPKNLIG